MRIPRMPGLLAAIAVAACLVLRPGGDLAAAPADQEAQPTPTTSAGLAWASLGTPRPIGTQPGGRPWSQALAADPADPRRIAYCASGSIQLSLDGGATWSSVPTTGVEPVAAATPYPLLLAGESTPTCTFVMLDPDHPQSVFAGFDGLQVSAPPVYRLGYQTTDGGQTWQPLPPPDGFTLGQFGGFQFDGRAVQALFVGRATGPGLPPPFAVRQTTDGGRTWTAGGLTCPTVGPCVRWGPAPASLSGMGAPRPQWILYSADGGLTWAVPAPPISVDLGYQGLPELVALSSSDVLLLANGEQDPVRLSRDGGRSWEAVALPLLPGPPSTQQFFPALRILPGGELLAYADGASPPAWQLLRPGASDWCPPAAELPRPAPSTMRVVGDRLWWLEDGSRGQPVPPPRSTALDDLGCGPSQGAGS